jgi:hypothetical protein
LGGEMTSSGYSTACACVCAVDIRLKLAAPLA